MAYEIATLSPPNQPNVTIHKNQSLVIVHKPKWKDDFLQIGNPEWKYVAKNLKDCSLKLYLYIASNRNSYQFALSYADVEEEIGMSKGAYHNALKELKEKRYLIKQFTKARDGYETWHFYTTPQVSEEDICITA